MKDKYLLYITICLMLVACEKKSYTLGSLGMPDPSLLLVKFPEAEDTNYVVAGQRYIAYEPETERYAFAENDSLTIYQLSNHLWDSVISFAQREMHIEGTSPYIPLTNGYYLIDWKWHSIHPFGFYNAWKHQLNPDFTSDVRSHIYFTNVKWKDLNDISSKYDLSQCTQNMKNTNVWQITYYELDHYFKEDNSKRMPYGESLYTWGLMLGQAYTYYDKYDRKGNTDELSYHDYVHFCDSLQNVYQQFLIQLINSNQLHKIAFQW